MYSFNVLTSNHILNLFLKDIYFYYYYYNYFGAEDKTHSIGFARQALLTLS